jgi:glycosyltransferase involved in cell wall biosynthesis
VWAEPDQQALADALRQVREATPAAIATRTARAKAVLMERFKWSDVADKLEQDVRHFARVGDLPKVRTGWVTTWNTRCGIATYSSNLVAGLSDPVTVLAADDSDRTFDDGPEVTRCWTRGVGDNLTQLTREIDRHHLQALVIQFQYAFFDFPHFARFLEAQKRAGRTVVVLMHATLDAAENPSKQLKTIASALAECDRVLVHSIADLNRLKALGVERNTALFPHGIMDAPEVPVRTASRSFHIASYGFFLPHKGLQELIEAVGIMRSKGVDARLTMVNAEYPDTISLDQIRRAEERVRGLRLQGHVRMVTDFLRDDVSLGLLQDADVVVFPYQGTGESASGAVRYGLASGRPVAVTPIPIFDDVGDIVHRMPGTSPAELAMGLIALQASMASGDEATQAIHRNAAQWRGEHRYPILARRLENITRQLAQPTL